MTMYPLVLSCMETAGPRRRCPALSCHKILRAALLAAANFSSDPLPGHVPGRGTRLGEQACGDVGLTDTGAQITKVSRL